MRMKDEILALLEQNRSEFVSGEDLAAKLDVSRAAVWKAVKALQEEGYSITAVPNRGYRLEEDADILSAQGISKYLHGPGAGLRICVKKSVSSTNTLLKQEAATGEPEGKVLVAEHQSQGKGRQGTNFFSPENAGIYMSLLLRPKTNAAVATLLTTAAAVAVAEAIETVAGREAQIKWVNDIFLEEKKVCGILTEAAFAMENGGLDYAVLGIGVNAYEPTWGFPPELRDIATVVFPHRSSDLRNRLAAEILNVFMGYYEQLENRAFVTEYRRRCFVLGRPILVVKGEETFPATALDLDENCRLQVRYDDGKEEFLQAGEIHVRPL